MRQRGWKLVALGASFAVAAENGFTPVAWSLEAEREWLSRAEVGFLPQSRDPWADRKSAYKVLEYLRGGACPVVDDVPAVWAALGDRAEQLAVVVNEGMSWAAATERALRLRNSADWKEAREACLASASLLTLADKYEEALRLCRRV
jgi:hypothetical protein